MKFTPLTSPVPDSGALAGEYKTAREIGPVRLGERTLFFRSGLRNYYIPYEDIGRLFRRVVSVPARLCCSKGELHLEHLVICGKDERELAQVQLPDTRAARALMEQLRTVAPRAEFGRPVQI